MEMAFDFSRTKNHHVHIHYPTPAFNGVISLESTLNHAKEWSKDYVIYRNNLYNLDGFMLLENTTIKEVKKFFKAWFINPIIFL